MAISLDDVERNQNQKRKAGTNGVIPPRDVMVKPWESYDKLGQQTRTISAKEAVLKARQIFQRTEVFSEYVQSLESSRQNPVDADATSLVEDITLKFEHIQIERLDNSLKARIMNGIRNIISPL